MIANTDTIIAAAAERIADIIGQRVVLKGRGNELKGACPFHHGTSGTSFTVSAGKALFHCFSCGIGGDVVSFIKSFHNLDFADAIELLAAEVNIPCEYAGDRPTGPTRQQLHAAADQATRHYQQNLATAHGKRGADYLAARGFTPEIIDRWRLGYAIADNVADCGAPLAHLQAVDAIRQGKSGTYDPLAGRVIIPMRAPAGHVVAFAGRKLPEVEAGPKYLNTSDTKLFFKGEFLFGLHESPRASEVYILEGQFKVIAAIEAGYAAVAPCGTGLTASQAAMIARRYSVVHLAYDADEAGAKAAIRTATILRQHGIQVDVAVLAIPAEAEDGTRDTDDLLRQHLPIDWQHLSIVQYLVETLVPTLDEAAGHRIHDTILPLIHAQPRGAVQEIEIAELADLTGIPAAALRPSREGHRPPPTASSNRRVIEHPPPPTDLDLKMNASRNLLAALLQATITPDSSPTWWEPYIDFLNLPPKLLAAVQDIALLRRRAHHAGLPISSAIERYATEPARSYYRHWLNAPLPRHADDAITECQADVVRSTLNQRLKDATAAGDCDAIAYHAHALNQ